MNNIIISDWIAIIGIIISIILAFLFYKKVRKKTIILIVKKHFILNNVKHSQYPLFKVLLDGEEILENLYSVEGFIIMTGDGDVLPENIRYPISIFTNENDGLWKNYNILDKTFLLDCNLKTEGNVLSFHIDSIKSNDYINFQAYYITSKIGFNANHRILDVEKEVRIFDENSVSFYKGAVTICSLLIIMILYALITSNDYLGEILLNDKYTKSTEKYITTKEDSLMSKSFDYKNLYYINKIAIENDLVLIKNKELNDKKNEVRKTSELKTLESIYLFKSSKFMKSVDSINILDKDSIYFYDKDLLEEDTRKLLIKILSQNIEIDKKNKYKINDTISVSFINNRNNLIRDNSNIFDVIFTIFFTIILIIIVMVEITSIYYLRILYQYRRIYKTSK